ncbi:MAG: hypothetical protein L0Y66_09180 [Myxococcaceae bacterium]|nr:hypothetical protein [Myxococcaceae bacterium]MCI0670401.1 hypothetical protein [Myxococcaceae bacterium]
MSRDDSHSALEHELAREKAGALTRVTAKLEATLAALGSLPSTDAQRTRLVAEAAEWLWYVVVQREAMGMTNHDVLYDTYKVPLEVRQRIGLRPR